MYDLEEGNTLAEATHEAGTHAEAHSLQAGTLQRSPFY